MAREVTWFDRSEHKLPDKAPLADPNERVMLRVPIGQREAPRATIPRLEPPAEVRMDPAQERGNESSGATQAEGGPEADRTAEEEHPRRWPAPREELEALVRQGLSNAEIADLYGVRRTTVQARLQYLGIRRDGATWARLKSMGGQKGAATTSRRYRELVGAPQEDGGEAVQEGAGSATKQAAAVDEFARHLARAVLQARAMGLDVEIRLRVGGAA